MKDSKAGAIVALGGLTLIAAVSMFACWSTWFIAVPLAIVTVALAAITAQLVAEERAR